jgi:hypothetical protein
MRPARACRGVLFCAHSAGSDECRDVRNHGGPPKTLSDESQGPTGTRMAGQSSGMHPFQDQEKGQSLGQASGYRPGSLYPR